jgi:hypothetical protein
MSARVTKAAQWNYLGGKTPQMHLHLKDDATNVLPDGWSDKTEYLVQHGTWHRVDHDTPKHLIYACDGDLYTTRKIRPDPKGNDSVHGDDGTEWKFSWWDWADANHLPDLGEVVKVSWLFEGTGNVQYGLFSKALVEAKIAEAKLDFAIQRNQVVYTGPMDRFRSTNVYQNYNGITWGIQFNSRAYEGAGQSDDWGGASWPDKATVTAVSKKFLLDGTKDVCANLHTLKTKFPGHPAIAKLEAWEAAQRTGK